MWEAIASLAWPLLAAIVIYKLWPIINDILRKDGTTIKVGSLEISVSDATRAIGKDVADIQERLSSIEARIGDASDVKRPEVPREQEEQKKRLLWVDDFPSNNAFIVEHLREKGIDVEISLSTEDALKRLEHRSYPAIVTDLGRIENGVDNPFAGLDLIERIRGKGSKVPILVFAGQRGIQNTQKLTSAGAENVTSSGVDVMTFIEKYVS